MFIVMQQEYSTNQTFSSFAIRSVIPSKDNPCRRQHWPQGHCLCRESTRFIVSKQSLDSSLRAFK